MLVVSCLGDLLVTFSYVYMPWFGVFHMPSDGNLCLHFADGNRQLHVSNTSQLPWRW